MKPATDRWLPIVRTLWEGSARDHFWAPLGTFRRMTFAASFVRELILMYSFLLTKLSDGVLIMTDLVSNCRCIQKIYRKNPIIARKICVEKVRDLRPLCFLVSCKWLHALKLKTSRRNARRIDEAGIHRPKTRNSVRWSKLVFSLVFGFSQVRESCKFSQAP